MSSPKPSTNGHWIGPIVDRYEGPLVRYAQRIVGDLDRARDVVQETFLSLYEQGQGTADGHLAPWLFAVCRRRALDVARKEQRMKSLDAEQAAACEAESATAGAALEERETTVGVLERLATLPINQQEVVRLKFQNGLSYREIAEVTGLSVTNVGYLLHTAISSLRKQLATSD